MHKVLMVDVNPLNRGLLEAGKEGAANIRQGCLIRHLWYLNDSGSLTQGKGNTCLSFQTLENYFKFAALQCI